MSDRIRRDTVKILKAAENLKTNATRYYLIVTPSNHVTKQEYDASRMPGCCWRTTELEVDGLDDEFKKYSEELK